MYARVTLLDIDTERVDVATATELYLSKALPRVREQEGYEGVLALSTPEGKGLVITFWASAEAADASQQTGFYAELLAEFVTLYRSPPGRERYEVAFAELPAPVSSPARVTAPAHVT